MMRSTVPLDDLVEWLRLRAQESMSLSESSRTKRVATFHAGKAAGFNEAAGHLERALADEADAAEPQKAPLRPVDPPRPPFHQPYA